MSCETSCKTQRDIEHDTIIACSACECMSVWSYAGLWPITDSFRQVRCKHCTGTQCPPWAFSSHSKQKWHHLHWWHLGFACRSSSYAMVPLHFRTLGWANQGGECGGCWYKTECPCCLSPSLFWHLRGAQWKRKWVQKVSSGTGLLETYCHLLFFLHHFLFHSISPFLYKSKKQKEEGFNQWIKLRSGGSQKVFKQNFWWPS